MPASSMTGMALISGKHGDHSHTGPLIRAFWVSSDLKGRWTAIFPDGSDRKRDSSFRRGQGHHGAGSTAGCLGQGKPVWAMNRPCRRPSFANWRRPGGRAASCRSFRGHAVRSDVEGADNQHRARKRVVKSIYAPDALCVRGRPLQQFHQRDGHRQRRAHRDAELLDATPCDGAGRDDAMLAVGSPEVSAIEFMNLRTRERRRVKQPSPVFQIFFVPQTNLVALGWRDQVGMINWLGLHGTHLPRRFDSDQRQTPIITSYSLLFSSFSQSF